MAILSILYEPDPRLRIVSQSVRSFDQTLEEISCNMRETMVHAKGMGLAAPQVNIHKRIVVAQLQKKNAHPYIGNGKITTFVNPEIIEKSSKKTSLEEGCLSVLEYQYAVIDRSAKITVCFADLKGQKQTCVLEGIDAVCLQHEIDHLDGILYIDYLKDSKNTMFLEKNTLELKG